MDLETTILTELKKRGIPVKEAYERIGVSKQTFYNKIKASKMDVIFLTKVKESLNIEIFDELIKAESLPKNNLELSGSDIVTAQNSLKQQNKGLIPFYNANFMAGKSETFYDDGTNHPDYYMDVPEFAGCIAFRAYGDSMEKIIRSSSVLFGLKMDEDWKLYLEYGQIYGITMKNGQRYLKYIQRADDHKNFFLLESENEKYQPFEVPKDKIKNIWLIQGWIDKRA